MRCPCGRRTGPARESSMLFISYGTRAGPVRDPQVCSTASLPTRKGIDTCRICKNHTWASHAAYGARMSPLRYPHGLFKDCLRSLNSYGGRKFIMLALKLYRPRTGGKIHMVLHRPRTGPVRRRTDFCSKQAGNSLGTARTGPGSVMWLGHMWNMRLLIHSQTYAVPKL